MTESTDDAHIYGFGYSLDIRLPCCLVDYIYSALLITNISAYLLVNSYCDWLGIRVRMALPALQIFENCAEWNKTVEPYLPQLYELSSKLVYVIQSHQGLDGLVELYTQTNPLISGFAISVFLGFIFLIVSEINQNFSQVDRCWSILPTFYVAHFDLWARLSGIDSSRIDTILLFCIAWTVSLTRSHLPYYLQ